MGRRLATNRSTSRDWVSTRRFGRAAVTICSLALLICCAASIAPAQSVNYSEVGSPPDPGLELLQEEPHDLVYFTEESGGGWVKARLLPFPNRKVPQNPTGTLKIEVVGIETEAYSAKWDDIARIDLWEERLERETQERIAKGDFAGAYPFLSVLIRDYPNRRGLRELRSEFLWSDAIKRAKSGELGPTLAMLEELRRYAPEFKPSTVLGAIGGVTDRLIKQLVEENELDLAQQLLQRLKNDYRGERLPSVQKWDEAFLQEAQTKREQAIAARDAKNYRLARELARESVFLKPDIAGGTTLIREIDEIYPLVNVGVLQTATELDPTRIDNWAARRAGRLIYRVLFEIQEAGSEGGVYNFIFGETEQSPDRLQFDMLLQPEKLSPPLNRINAFFLADVMAARARPESPIYFSPWAAAIESIALDGPQQIRNLLRRPNVLPSALLQVTVDGSWFGGEPGSPTGDYQRDVMDEDEVRYTLIGEPKTPDQPREIVEIRSESAAAAVRALLQGEVDVLDQLFPADAARLRQNDSVQVANYPLPTMHMLVPCSDHAYLADRRFRRALIYGINRHDVLHGELLESKELPGCRVVSGPFPAGIERNDPLGYAYDQSILPRRYEPRLAKLLMTMTANQMKAEAERKKEEPPELKPIRLAYPPDNLSRIACEAIRTQLQLLDLEVQLVELPVGHSYPKEGTADLVYLAAAVWEPIIDARRVLGPEGLARSTDQLVGLGLRRLEESKNWKEARDRLLVLHGIAHNELPVLPLWQLVDSYAYRRELVGMGSDIVSLYQNVNNWRLQP